MPLTDRLLPSPVGPRLRRLATLGASSACGLGYLPYAPGTWGTLAALPLWWAMATLSPAAYVALLVAATLAAMAISHAAEGYYGCHDVGHIVIDEVVGLLCTAVLVPWRAAEVLAAFVLFRLLDAIKPWPISWVDAHVAGGVGVVLDDVVAGCVACALLHLARLFFGGWW